MASASRNATSCRSCSRRSTSTSSSASNARSTARDCSIPARSSRRCTAAPSSAACTCTRARWRSRIFRVSNQALLCGRGDPSESRDLVRPSAPANPGSYSPRSLWLPGYPRRRGRRGNGAAARLGLRMSDDNLKPRGATDVKEAIRWALAGGKTLEVVGRGSKRAIGRAAQWDATLDLSALTGVTLYEPEELVLSTRAGTPLAEIEALIVASKQELAFEPMDYGPLLGTAPGAATIGGVLAANLSGPRRIKAGAAPGHFLGFP